MSVTLCFTEPRRSAQDFQLEDPLAFSVLEAQIASRLWPGFTRHTTQPAYYVMVCYGLLMAETAATQHGLTQNDDTIRTLFHRWERLWALAVCLGHDGDLSNEVGMRGKDGVLAAYHAPTLDYRFLARRRELSSLGAYLTSLREHGLVRPDRLRLTPMGWDLAQWMFDADASFEKIIVTLLRPGNSDVPKQARSSLVELGKRGALSAIAARQGVRPLLWHRLFESTDARFAVLREMTKIVQTSDLEPRALLEQIAGSGSTSSKLRDLATLAIVFGDLTMSLRTIFDRMYQAVLSRGYASDWGECVHAAIPAGFAAVLNSHIANWRRFSGAEPLLATMTYGPKLNQVVRRLNSQNAYHIFESVLHLHVQMQRVRGKGAWIDRKGEVVYLRHSGYDVRALEGGEWAPGYRVGMMRKLIAELSSA